MTAYLAPALTQLRDEVNARYPGRDKTSDGWIGDPAHAARVSDHNPDPDSIPPGVVRALDIDITPDGTTNSDLATDLLTVTIGDPRTWYVIHAGKIYSRTYGWTARVYTGLNPHDGHVHISLLGVQLTEAAAAVIAEDTTPWWDPKPQQTLPAVSLTRVRAAARAPRRALHPVDVRRVQRALNARLHAGLRVDGVYGAKTHLAARVWEQQVAITHKAVRADGILGPITLPELGAGRFRVVP